MTKAAFDVLLNLLLSLLRLQRLPLVHVLVLERLLDGEGHDGTLLLLLLEDVLGAGACPRVHHVCPVLRSVSRKLFPPLDNEDAGIADLATSRLLELETLLTSILVLPTVREPRTA